MTPDEFKDFRLELAATIPTLLAWFQKLDARAQAKQREIWWTVLSPFPYEQILDALDAMTTGKAPPLGEWDRDRERVADHIVGVIRSKQSKHGDKVEDAAQRIRDAVAHKQAGAAGNFSKAFALHSGGMPLGEAMTQVFGEPDPENERKHAIACRQCKDSGVVEVWRKEAILAVVEGIFDDTPEFRVYGCVRCSCAAGDKRFGGARYALESWCPCPRGDTSDPQNIVDLKSWVAAKQQTATDQRLELGQRNLWN